MADLEEDGRQEERAHGNHAKGSGAKHGNHVHRHDPLHGNCDEVRDSRYGNHDREYSGDQPGTSQTGTPAAAMAGSSASTSGDPVLERVLGCLQSLSDCLTALEESSSVLAAPVQLANCSTSDSDCVDDQQTDELGQFLDGEFSPMPDQVGDSDAFADSLASLGAMFGSGSDVGKPMHETGSNSERCAEEETCGRASQEVGGKTQDSG